MNETYMTHIQDKIQFITNEVQKEKDRLQEEVAEKDQILMSMKEEMRSYTLKLQEKWKEVIIFIVDPIKQLNISFI